jgi:hypothetical protein
MYSSGLQSGVPMLPGTTANSFGGTPNGGALSAHNAGKLRLVEGQRIIDDYNICDEEILKPHEQIIKNQNPKARIIWISDFTLALL